MTLETREFEVRAVDAAERTITGIAAPYGQVIKIGGYRETFERGAFGSPENVLLFYGHSEPIGRVTEYRDTDEGFEITARISNTTRGNDTYNMLKDGTLNRFSVGFAPVKHRSENGVTVRTAVDLKEVSVVPFPAYSQAEVKEVRADEYKTAPHGAEGEKMSDITNVSASDLDEVRGTVEDLQRSLAVLQETDSNKGGVVYRSGGEWLKALADGSTEARDFGTTVDADVTRPGWVNERLARRLNKRPTINAFSKGALPASGNSVEYPYIKTETGEVGVQSAEGANLPYLEVVLDTATAPVKTYGGYISVSRQAIERSDLAYLESALEFMVDSYAKATEKAVRDALVAATGVNEVALAADTPEAWIDVVIDASAEIEENGTGEAEFVYVSLDVFKTLARMVDGAGRPLFSLSGQSVNSLGEANLVVPRGSIAGLPIVVNASLADATMFVADSDAVKVLESAGAPFRLQDENIINLTKDFSLYGYMAVAVQRPTNLTKVDVEVA